MKRHRRRPKRQLRAIRLWSYPEAVKALPYLRSLTGSLREFWLELQGRQLAAQRLHDRRLPTRQERIALEDARADASRAEEKFDDALAELMRLDIFLLDPVRGLALIPFQQEEELAWYVFDLFDEAGLTTWRYHKDPLDTRRPVPKGRSDEAPLIVGSGTV